ncbi:MAG: hypothetical protein A1D16_09160 [Flavihumibacter sp. CACIAM 22H1]|nr:MAG: hypothetical protein A1D16_09160 [Flavihumibacter sp. CACIAM 22H1]
MALNGCKNRFFSEFLLEKPSVAGKMGVAKRTIVPFPGERRDDLLKFPGIKRGKSVSKTCFSPGKAAKNAFFAKS